MTEQDKKYVVEALEYALHKCINVDGYAETHYNTLTNALELVKNCSIHSVSKHVVCDGCGDTGRGKPTLQEPDGIDCEKCSSK